MLNTDEYMKTIIGDTYTRSEINIKEPTLQTVDLYPESYLKINPIVINKCKKITQKPTKTIINQITDEIFKELNEKNNGTKEVEDKHPVEVKTSKFKEFYDKSKGKLKQAFDKLKEIFGKDKQVDISKENDDEIKQ